MPRFFCILFCGFLFLAAPLRAQESHNHAHAEQLGKVSFPVSCAREVQTDFNRAVALLHSFAYADAREVFRRVGEKDPHCAMAHWGIAMSYFHPLWEPPLPAEALANAPAEIQKAREIGTASEREEKFIHALALIFLEDNIAPVRTRLQKYQHAMGRLAEENPEDAECQIFYALALLGNSSPSDKTHKKQKRAADILEPLWKKYPEHPGIPHYLIHAYDNAELASRGADAAREYAQIAASAPHALHMPSHIFTRLGLWEDSVRSNLAAKQAAKQQHDIGEQLHAMDYLVYAYLQLGKSADAAKILSELNKMTDLNRSDFKVAYASVAMPVRYAVERSQWKEAAAIRDVAGVPPQVNAVQIWARGLGLAKTGRVKEAEIESEKLKQVERQLQETGSEYWLAQTRILRKEVEAWCSEATGKQEEALSLLREAADEEDSLEKLPVTPGPILPAREQLGNLLLQQKHSALAQVEFEKALVNAPGRRAALEGKARAAKTVRLVEH